MGVPTINGAGLSAGWLAGHGVNIREHNGSFHAKVYIFRHRNVTHAWVGSNNLSQSAFHHHDEIALETIEKSDVEELEAWFEDRWEAAASRRVRSLWGTSVALGSGGATVDCRFEIVHVNARSSRSFYWNTTSLPDETIREDTKGEPITTPQIEDTWVSVPRDAVTDEPILGTVGLHHSNDGGEPDQRLLRACQASGSPLVLRIGPAHGGAFCDVSVAELHHSEVQADNWDAVLQMESCFRKRKRDTPPHSSGRA